MVDFDTSADGDSARGGHADRLDSWKRIAAYLKRDVSTVQRWERREGMPVHRHLHDKQGSVFAFRSELDAWWDGRRTRLGAAPAADRAVPAPHAATPPPIAPATRVADAAPQPPSIERARRSERRWPRLAGSALLVALTAAVVAGAWVAVNTDRFSRNPLADAKFIRSASFATTAQGAAISRDGRYVAFLAELDGRTDAWIGEFGRDDYVNLTRGSVRELVNPSVRTLGFSWDSSLVTVWTRREDGAQPDDVNVVAAPVAGGALEPYLPNAAELDWSPDGTRVVYHTTAPGDPLYVREPGNDAGAADRRIYQAPAGVHSHFPVWSPDGEFVYFVRGVPRDRWDVWRIRPSGTGLERITRHDTNVAYPQLIDLRTLIYLATDQDGSGPWIYSMDVERRIPHRLSSGLETYTSLAASRDGARLVATAAHRRTSLWRLPLVRDGGAVVGAEEPTLLATDGQSPRVGRDFVLFVATRGDRQGVWTLADGAAHELWSREHSRIVGAPAIAPDGRRIAFTADHDGKTRLYVIDSDGSAETELAAGLALSGSPVWWPDGESIVSAAIRDGEPHLTRIFLNGEPPVVLVSEYSLDPTWSPGNEFLVYSGADVGTTFPLRAAEPDGRPRAFTSLLLTRGARRVAFLDDRPTLIYLSGEVGHKDVWLMDLESGSQRPLTALPRDFVVADFDVSADGAELVLGRVEERSELALIERPQ